MTTESNVKTGWRAKYHQLQDEMEALRRKLEQAKQERDVASKIAANALRRAAELRSRLAHDNDPSPPGMRETY